MLGLLLNRYVMGAIVMAAAAAAFLFWLKKHDAELEAKVIARINQAAEELADAAVEARAPALRPGAFARLRQEHCSNCTAELPRAAVRDDRQ
jgi:Flp pilus assembly protein TadB